MGTAQALQSASFAGNTGTLLTRSGKIIVVGRDASSIDEHTRDKRVILEACDVWGGCFEDTGQTANLVSRIKTTCLHTC